MHNTDQKANYTPTINTTFAFSAYLQSKILSLAAHTTNTIYSTLQNMLQIPNFASQNTNQGSLACQNPLKFHELKQSELSIKLKSHIPFQFNTKNSNHFHNSSAQLVINKNLFIALSYSTNVSDKCYIDSIINSSTTSQISAMKGKSATKTSARTSPRVSFTMDTVPNTTRQSPSHSKISTPPTDRPQVLTFVKVVGKVFNKEFIQSLTRKDAVLKK